MDASERRTVGARIAEARHHSGLTQKELAARLDVSVRTLQNYEAGVVVPYRHLRSIESLGGKRRGWLLEGGEDSELLSTISSLQLAMERHQRLMQSHLQEMQRHTTRLRELRQANAERRGRGD